jgi:NAD(P)-dependent dehydrogenase (short-subunit alcohol dehydrogenase family)
MSRGSEAGGESPFEGRSAVVTGGASGLGRATAQHLAAAGCRVVIADLDSERGGAVAEQIDGHYVRVDVSDAGQNERMVAAAEQHHGGLDYAFLNAGVSTGCGLGEGFDLELYRRAMGTNLDGVVFGVQAALPALRRAGGGAIVATSSLAGLTAVPYDPIYAANKHAVVGLVRSLGPGLRPDGIRINAICPGFADTAIIEPIKDDLEAGGTPIIRPDEIAEIVTGLLAGPQSGECWFIQPGRAGAFEFRNLPGPRA